MAGAPSPLSHATKLSDCGCISFLTPFIFIVYGESFTFLVQP